MDSAGDLAMSGDETCQRTSYARNDATGLIDLVDQQETLSVPCGSATTPAQPSTVLSRARRFYDTYVDDSSFGLAPIHGDAVREETLASFTGSTPNYVPSTWSTFDVNGRALTVQDALGHTTTSTYTTANGGLVTQTAVANALGQTTTTTFEPAWGSATHISDPNGIVTDLTYDGLGRLTNVWLPGRSKATQTASVTFAYVVHGVGGPAAVTTKKLLPTGSGYRTSATLYDGWLRVRQTQTQATGGGRTLTDTFYNTLGQVATVNNAYYDQTNAAVSTTLGYPLGVVPSATGYTYDGAGRTTAEILYANGPEKWRTTTAYGGDRTHTTPPAGGTATTTITDARGNTVALRQYHNPADVGSTNPATYDQTSYTHTLLNQLTTTTTDAAGHIWSNGYDLRGNVITHVDPDSGTLTSTYDDAGNLTGRTAPLGTGTATVAYTYDALNRKITMRDDTSTGTIRAQWVYDTLSHGIGKLTSATRYVSGNAYVSKVDAYDTFGRPTSTSVVLPASETSLCAAAAPNTCTYTTPVTYKTNSELSTETLPAAADLASEKLTYGYTAGTLFSASQIYVDSVQYNKLDLLTQRVVGDSSINKQIAVTTTYDEPTRRVSSTNVVPALQPEAANWSYTYNNAGAPTQISEAPSGGSADIQCYSYDYLGRLTDAWTIAAGACGAIPTTWSQVGGPASYWQTWSLDVSGNRQSEVRHGSTNTTYTYAHTDWGTPHGATQVVANGGSSWTRNYTYDNAGNTATRPTAAGATQTLT